MRAVINIPNEIAAGIALSILSPISQHIAANTRAKTAIIPSTINNVFRTVQSIAFDLVNLDNAFIDILNAPIIMPNAVAAAILFLTGKSDNKTNKPAKIATIPIMTINLLNTPLAFLSLPTSSTILVKKYITILNARTPPANFAGFIIDNTATHAAITPIATAIA